MYAKSFLARDGHGRLTGARTARRLQYDRYTCHLCGSALQYHPEDLTGRPWFEHTHGALTENGRNHCPYVVIAPDDMRLIRRLQCLASEVRPVLRKAQWYCTTCHRFYQEGERYCSGCRTGASSTDASARLTLLWTPEAGEEACEC